MQVEKSKSLRAYNTFGIDVSARYFAEITNVEDIRQLMGKDIFKENELLVLGGGSNILFTQDVNALVLKNSIPGISVVKEDEKFVWVRSGSGENWHGLVLWCIENNYGGIENLSLIPGLAGAAPMQNIGAYGVEVKDVLETVEALHVESGELRQFTNAQCRFGYRESIFKHEAKGKYIITGITLRLQKTDEQGTGYIFKTSYGDIKNQLAEKGVYHLSLRSVSDAIISIRNSKLPNPAEIGNAGSFFKNPVIGKLQYEQLVARYPLMPNYPATSEDGTDVYKIPAGWLIEQCGWKGKRVGSTGSHVRQALVLVNYGGATGGEILALSKQIQQSVMDKFGIGIETEVNIV